MAAPISSLLLSPSDPSAPPFLRSDSQLAKEDYEDNRARKEEKRLALELSGLNPEVYANELEKPMDSPVSKLRGIPLGTRRSSLRLSEQDEWETRVEPNSATGAIASNDDFDLDGGANSHQTTRRRRTPQPPVEAMLPSGRQVDPTITVPREEEKAQVIRVRRQRQHAAQSELGVSLVCRIVVAAV